MKVVKKYGGTSVATIDKIRNIAHHLIEKKNEGQSIVVVVSAMNKTTDELISLAEKISPDYSLRELDALLATGEQQSAVLLTMALHSLGAKAISLNGNQLNIKTTTIHSKGQIIDYAEEKLLKYLDDDYIVVVTGFQGINENGDVTTLGRGGSDTSAIAIASKIQAECEIYTDVPGIFRVNPKDFPQAQQFKTIDYNIMMQLAVLGAKVIEPRAVEIAKKYNIKLYIGQSLRPNSEGTYIMDKQDFIEKRVVSGLGVEDDVEILTIISKEENSSIMANLFVLIKKYGINVDMIAQTVSRGTGSFEVSFSYFGPDSKQIRKMIEENSSFFGNLNLFFKSNLIKLSVVGIGMATYSGFASRLFSVLHENKISFHSVTTSEISVSIAIDKDQKQKAIQVLAQEFDL